MQCNLLLKQFNPYRNGAATGFISSPHNSETNVLISRAPAVMHSMPYFVARGLCSIYELSIRQLRFYIPHTPLKLNLNDHRDFE